MLQATRTGTSLVFMPSEVNAKLDEDPSFSLRRMRLIGRVTSEEIIYEVEPRFRLEFTVEDPKSPNGSVPVKYYNNPKPDMFAPGRDVIIDGEFKDGTMTAAKLATQCPSKYEPPKVTETSYEVSKPKEEG